MSDSDDSSTYAYFPPELEQPIVEMVAFASIQFPLTSGNTCLSLQLTSKRFRAWVMPFLFRVVYASKEHLYPRLRKRDYLRALRKYGKYATHVNGNAARPCWLQKVLERCPNVTDIIFWDHLPIKEPGEVVVLHQLKRLSTSMAYLEMEQIHSPNTYANVTHLNLIDTDDWELIVEFKNLTHLCFNHVRPQDSTTMLDTIMNRSVGCPSLQVLIATTAHQIPFVTHHDPRYILLQGEGGYVNDWVRGVNGGLELDLWQFAERIAFARKRGYIIDVSKTIIRSKFDTTQDLDSVGQLWWSHRDQSLEDERKFNHHLMKSNVISLAEYQV